MERLNRQSEDSLSKLLRVVNVHSTGVLLVGLPRTLGLHVDDSAVAKFHLTLEGAGVETLDGGDCSINGAESAETRH